MKKICSSMWHLCKMEKPLRLLLRSTNFWHRRSGRTETLICVASSSGLLVLLIDTGRLLVMRIFKILGMLIKFIQSVRIKRWDLPRGIMQALKPTVFCQEKICDSLSMHYILQRWSRETPTIVTNNREELCLLFVYLFLNLYKSTPPITLNHL